MAYPTFTSAEVMDRVAALCNDAAKSIYTYVSQLPYLNMALQELQEFFELNEVPVTETVSAVMTVPTGTDHIGFAASGLMLPNDLVEPQYLWERQSGIDPYTTMTKLDVLPRYMEGVEINQFIYYTWQSQEIRFLPANQDNDIKMDYTRFLFAELASVTGADNINVINSKSFLEYRTAGLCAKYLGENDSRAVELNNSASLAMDRVIGVGTKGRQNITIRHRPFRSSYKRRTYS